MIDHKNRIGQPYQKKGPPSDETRRKISATLKANRAAVMKASAVATSHTMKSRKNRKALT